MDDDHDDTAKFNEITSALIEMAAKMMGNNAKLMIALLAAVFANAVWQINDRQEEFKEDGR
jgi:hypothetical protein